MEAERVNQDLRMPAGVKLFNTHGPYRWDTFGTLRNPCAYWCWWHS
jgi:hypothetical protein